MGRHIIKFKCRHSNHCCRDVVCLPTPWDVLRIAMNTGRDPRRFLEFLSPEEITGVNKNDPTWLKIGTKRYIMALRRDEVQGCCFLERKSRLCSIYEHRPLLCRLYPFKLQETRDGAFKGFSLHTDVGCPRHLDGEVAAKPLYELYLQDKMHQDDYVTLVEIFNRQKEPGRKPEDFLDLFMEVERQA